MRDADSRSPGLVDRKKVERAQSSEDDGRVTPSFVVRGSDSKTRTPDDVDWQSTNIGVEIFEGSAPSLGLWKPRRLPADVLTLSPDNIARMRLIWLSFGLIAAVVILGLTAVFVLSIMRIDTMPMMQYLAMVVAPVFSGGLFSLGYYFGRRKKPKEPTV